MAAGPPDRTLDLPRTDPPERPDMTTTATLDYPPPTTAPVHTPPGRTGALIGGGLLAPAGAAPAIGGGALLAIGGSDGTFATGHHDVSTTTHALVSKVATIDGSRDLT